MDVFISRPNWISDEYEEGLKIFLQKLGDLQLNPRTLGSTDYGTKSPLDEVIRIMDNCNGAIILGYPQIIIKEGTVKENNIDEILLLPTEWNHIEAGLAYARNLPLIVIHHSGISRGIFDRGALNSYIFDKDFSNPNWSFDKDVSGALKIWRDDVLGYLPLVGNSSLKKSLNKLKDKSITLLAINRTIKDSSKIGNHKESTSVKIKELHDQYVLFQFEDFDEEVSIPYSDMTMNLDTNRNKPMIELRAV